VFQKNEIVQITGTGKLKCLSNHNNFMPGEETSKQLSQGLKQA
jgi:hypothetical protein